MGERAATSATEETGRKPLLARLSAWFGLADPAPIASPQRRRRLREGVAAQPATAPLQPDTVAQWLWGEGCLMPGDADFVLELVKPFGLTPAMSMLDLAAGLGGAARAVAHSFGAYVTGLERSEERARLGMQMSVTANLAKRATVAPYNPETVELRANGFDCVLGRAATHAVVEKERLLRVLANGLKQRGQLLLNEFTIDRAAGQRPELAAWMAREMPPPRLWTIDQYADCLGSLGFDVRIIEDLSNAYRAMIIGGWAHMLKAIDLRSMPRQHLVAVVDEAELWMRRIAALESGALRIYKIYALLHKPAR